MLENHFNNGKKEKRCQQLLLFHTCEENLATKLFPSVDESQIFVVICQVKRNLHCDFCVSFYWIR